MHVVRGADALERVDETHAEIELVRLRDDGVLDGNADGWQICRVEHVAAGQGQRALVTAEHQPYAAVHEGLRRRPGHLHVGLVVRVDQFHAFAHHFRIQFPGQFDALDLLGSVLRVRAGLRLEYADLDDFLLLILFEKGGVEVFVRGAAAQRADQQDCQQQRAAPPESILHRRYIPFLRPG